VTIFSPELLNQSIETVNRLRQDSIAAELFLDPETKLDKQIRYADKKGIDFVVVIGPDEAEKETITLKNLKTGEQKTIPLSSLPEAIKKQGR
jgi:histidyl-tRNA synthetase